MAGPQRKRYTKEKKPTETESSSGQQSSGKESSLQRVTTRSSPQSLPRYDGNRDPNPTGAAPLHNVVTSANLRRLEMSFGMWAAYRGVSTVLFHCSSPYPCVTNPMCRPMSFPIFVLLVTSGSRLTMASFLLRLHPSAFGPRGDCKTPACIVRDTHRFTYFVTHMAVVAVCKRPRLVHILLHLFYKKLESAYLVHLTHIPSPFRLPSTSFLRPLWTLMPIDDMYILLTVPRMISHRTCPPVRPKAIPKVARPRFSSTSSMFSNSR